MSRKASANIKVIQATIASDKKSTIEFPISPIIRNFLSFENNAQTTPAIDTGTAQHAMGVKHMPTINNPPEKAPATEPTVPHVSGFALSVAGETIRETIREPIASKFSLALPTSVSKPFEFTSGCSGSRRGDGIGGGLSG